MWLISEEQQDVLYRLTWVLNHVDRISDVHISEKSGKGDKIEDLVVEFSYETNDWNKTIYFARAPNYNQLEIWQDTQNTLPENLKQHISKELPNFSYSQEKNVHVWTL